MLTKQEKSRYERQLIIPGWNEAGQEKLKNAKIIVAGAGGLGSSVLTYLAAAGIGNIRIVDNDVVELSNLNRQILHADKNINKKKVDSAKERLTELNPDIQIETVFEKITEKNVYNIVEDFPIVDAMDNLSVRYLLNEVSIAKKIPLFHGAVYGFEGRATTIIPGKTSCIRCIYKDAMTGKTPVVGVTPGIIGCIQANEVIKYILGIGKLLTNRLLIYDGLSSEFTEVQLKRDLNCKACRHII